jgi:hypothetical protein
MRASRRRSLWGEMDQQPPNKSGAQIVFKIFETAIIGVAAAVAALLCYWWFVPPKIVAEADAGFKRAKLTINPEELRAWALESIKRWPATNGFQTIPESEVPKYIQNLYSYPPEDATIAGDTVTIFWGGGFFHWVIEVGSTNYVRSMDKSSGYQTAEWTNGIYYSHEGHRKIH